MTREREVTGQRAKERERANLHQKEEILAEISRESAELRREGAEKDRLLLEKDELLTECQRKLAEAEWEMERLKKITMQ
ncbi:hypothetical protein N7488_008851 [Penicillium malachiteum]|nr:hypothetical protein N7488_008851 [Penicillium malachiteum]